jgi:3-isopropylmalate/(R)-2-methylmalate dehydratase small subunit
VDLPAQKVIAGEGMTFAFEIGGVQKMCLVKGLDEVSLTETHNDEIAAFETAYDREFPWLKADRPAEGRR